MRPAPVTFFYGSLPYAPLFRSRLAGTAVLLSDFLQEVVGRYLPAIALDRAQRGVLAFLGIGAAGIRHECHQIVEVAGVTHCRFHALVCHKAAQYDLFDAQVTQQIVDMGRHEDTRGAFRQDDLVLERLELVDDLAVPGALRDIEAGDLVIQAAVPSVLRQAFDCRVQHLYAGLAKTGEQALHVRDRHLVDALEIIAVFAGDIGVGNVLELAPFAADGKVLHVDEQDCGSGRIERYVSGGQMVSGHHGFL
ncbi:hypothetical protein EMEDMD4_790384 [Sinorhizobium medicae]|uniref:Uncharacterized protein n=1 Tax=Sinorhizobium medicae TaxID=110321 RepID=A0A508X722_9HYPH|nr:hypothetical protein EMEDMD4_790384 [Sinorhizobium medicae]